MNDEKSKTFIDENGEKWKTVKEIPCPRNLESRKQTFKICFEVEYELELTESQKPHQHIIREKEVSENINLLDKYLYGDIEDFGGEDCVRMRAITLPKINIKQKKSANILENSFPNNYSAEDKDFCLLNHFILRKEIKYLEKHLANELEYVFLKLWNESKDNFVKNSQKTIDRYLKKENKRLRERIKSVRFVDPEEMLKFTNEISKIVHKLHQKKLKINRANISKNYRSGSNSYQTLRRKLEDLNLTFDELLEIVNTKNQ
jgi:hypothetical protein